MVIPDLHRSRMAGWLLCTGATRDGQQPNWCLLSHSYFAAFAIAFLFGRALLAHWTVLSLW